MGRAEEVDVQSILARYRAERDKRMAAEGHGRFAEAGGDLAHVADVDPQAEAVEPRDPIVAETDVLIVGAGFSGLLAAARLAEVGITDIRIVDKASDFGGTWYWNRYPGVQCDIESYCYLPLLEETGYVPRHKYAFGDEIASYCQLAARHYDLYPVTSFQTAVSEVIWDDELERWQVSTDRGDVFSARFFVLGIGSASQPRLPGIEGIERFQGHSFHSARWDYEHTGGHIQGDLVGLADKRVAVIGTGASGVQIVPHVATTAKHLYVFQRTPSSVADRRQATTDPEWYQTLGPGWQAHRRTNFLDAAAGRLDGEDLVDDGWTEILHILREEMPEWDGTIEALRERYALADLAVMNRRRDRVDQLVQDPQTAEALKPWYNLFCKRPCFNDEFLPAFNRANVTLVDVSGTKAITEITETAIVADGRAYEVDTIIYASGFQIAGPIQRRMSFDVIGRGGVSLHEHWADGFRTLHGLMTSGFPNWFFIGQGQSVVGSNYTAMADDHARHIAHIVGEATARGIGSLEVTPEAEATWVAEIRANDLRPPDFLAACTPGYYNNEGDLGITMWDEAYAGGEGAFNALLARWRDDGRFEGLRVR